MAQKDTLLEHIQAHPLTRVGDLYAAGFTRMAVRRAIERGDLVKLARGIVGAPEASAAVDLPELLACMTTGGVLGCGTAAARHSLTNALPTTVDIIVPHAVVRPRLDFKDRQVRIFRTRDARALTLGVQSETQFGVELRVTSPARTVVDLWRTMKKGSEQHVWEAVHRYLDEGGSAQELRDLAEAFGIRDPVDLFLAARSTSTWNM